MIQVLPAEALSVDCRDRWQSIRQVAKVERTRTFKKKGKWVAETETAWLITSLSAQQALPEALLGYNRQHCRIENNLHRNKIPWGGG